MTKPRKKNSLGVPTYRKLMKDITSIGDIVTAEHTARGLLRKLIRNGQVK